VLAELEVVVERLKKLIGILFLKNFETLNLYLFNKNLHTFDRHVVQQAAAARRVHVQVAQLNE